MKLVANSTEALMLACDKPPFSLRSCTDKNSVEQSQYFLDPLEGSIV
jgi:hypothetical protein